MLKKVTFISSVFAANIPSIVYFRLLLICPAIKLETLATVVRVLHEYTCLKGYRYNCCFIHSSKNITGNKFSY